MHMVVLNLHCELSVLHDWNRRRRGTYCPKKQKCRVGRGPVSDSKGQTRRAFIRETGVRAPLETKRHQSLIFWCGNVTKPNRAIFATEVLRLKLSKGKLANG